MPAKLTPHDDAGKALIQQIFKLAQQKEFRRRVVFLEDYDMAVARALVQGCDVWLNTPLRPLEASGTSGMKALANGVLNLSTLDGWWDEAWQAATPRALLWDGPLDAAKSMRTPSTRTRWRPPHCTTYWNRFPACNRVACGEAAGQNRSFLLQVLCVCQTRKAAGRVEQKPYYECYRR